MAKSNPTRLYDDKHLKRMFPSWYSVLYGAACGFLIPWTIFLSIVLPPHYVSNHWDVAWVGFDIFECMLFALTAFLAFKHSSWTAFTSVMLGTALLIDAWFDVMTARTTRDIKSALVEAVIIEIPLALISFYISYRIFEGIRRKYAD